MRLISQDLSKHRSELRVVVPKRQDILKEIHESVSGGHLGITRTLGKLKSRYHWIGQNNDVKLWC